MRYRWVFGSIVLVVLIVLAWPFIMWQVKEKFALSLVVIDKTVPRHDYREHLGLYWVLEHLKIVAPAGTYYNLKTDYYGHDPISGRSDRNLTFNETPDLIYVADTYGVYEADLENAHLDGVRSSMLYGGLMSYEWDQIIQAKSEATTLIVEFNAISSPTSDSVRTIVEEALGLRWTGWIGRYFNDLQSREVPVWMREAYERQTGLPWSMQGAGIAFANEADEIVLLQGGEFTERVSFEWTAVGRERYPDAVNSSYDYWFDIMEPSERMEVEAYYRLAMEPAAEDKLRQAGIPLQFPAVLHNYDEKLYYFAGDYADIGTSYFARWLPSQLYYSLLSFVREDERFYWRTYLPMMKRILTDAVEGRQTRLAVNEAAHNND